MSTDWEIKKIQLCLTPGYAWCAELDDTLEICGVFVDIHMAACTADGWQYPIYRTPLCWLSYLNQEDINNYVNQSIDSALGAKQW